MVEAMYFADDADTAWAEWYRALAEFAIPPDHQMPRDLWRCQIDLDGVADLSQEDALNQVGLARPRPSRSEWSSFQSVGAAMAGGLSRSSCAECRSRILQRVVPVPWS